MRSTANTLFTLAALISAASAEAAPCESLANLTLPQTSVSSARTVAAGMFVPPDITNSTVVPTVYKNLPAFCRVEGVIRPVADSHIEFEVWLPLSGWNSRYLGIGNGGFAGSLRYASRNAGDVSANMSLALSAGRHRSFSRKLRGYGTLRAVERATLGRVATFVAASGGITPAATTRNKGDVTVPSVVE